MSTNKINPTNNTQNNGKKNKAARAGAAVVAGGAAAAGVAYATGAFGAEDTELPEGEILEEPVAGGEAAAQPSQQSGSGHTGGSTGSGSAGTSGAAGNSAGGSGSTSGQNSSDNTSGQNSSGNTSGQNSSDNSGQSQTDGSQGQPDHEEEVNPDEIADAIIAEDQIDPNDIDMADVFNFNEIGTVYTVEGESYTMATYHDADGNEMNMVDIDGNGYFDLVLDENLVAVSEIDEVVSVSDVEVATSPDSGYLAANTDEEPSLPTGEDIMNDLIQA